MIGRRHGGLIGALWAAGILGVGGSAHAEYTHNGASTNDTIVVGCRAGKTAICDDGVLTEVEQDCTLSDDLLIKGNDGNDTLTLVRVSASYTCDGSTSSITELVYNGHYVNATGDAGDDTITGATGTHTLTGGEGADYIAVYSTSGYGSGEGGSDDVVSNSASAGWEVYGGSHDDCVGIITGDPDTAPDVIDCGSHTSADTYTNVANFTETACETAVSSCI